MELSLAFLMLKIVEFHRISRLMSTDAEEEREEREGKFPGVFALVGVCALVYVCRCLCVQKSMYKHACLHSKSNCGSFRAPAGLVLSANVHWLGHVWGHRQEVWV